ncbi:universal stress protein [Brevibacterium sediminis]|uniref:universal stress protein n=1 Tax=Brevibacterium sediminis TaxID=1857024 RepID=UPI002174EB20|nr:universal stress protein [Brevibacterium sediminis]MCS4594872.1 universal stress protein [Brevibacterium sediminis]
MTTSPDPIYDGPPRARIILGVVPDQPAEVIAAAADYAAHFDAELVCAHVDDSRYTVETRPDGYVLSMPIDPDTTDEAATEFDPELQDRIAVALEGTNVAWSTRALAGSPAQELDRLAEALDARMIILGVRRAGVLGSLHEFFNGSVAIQLSRRQHRPLVVVPLATGTGGIDHPEAPATSPTAGASPVAETQAGEGEQ